jgi:hypothetical protein
MDFFRAWGIIAGARFCTRGCLSLFFCLPLGHIRPKHAYTADTPSRVEKRGMKYIAENLTVGSAHWHRRIIYTSRVEH